MLCPKYKEFLKWVVYQVYPRSFYDTNGDGIGDLNGVNRKLDYICGDENGLGCDMIWLMPVFPSPTYHKYDVTDYEAVDPQYGSLEDMDLLIKACHERGVRLILDLPLNHTSISHPWFEAAADYLSTLKEGREADNSACPFLDDYLQSTTSIGAMHRMGVGECHTCFTGFVYKPVPVIRNFR